MRDLLEVIKGCVDKNPKYQQAIYEHYRAYAFKIAFRYMHTQEQANDVINDGFVKLLNNIHKFEVHADVNDEKLFMGWLKKIIINIAIDKLRRKKLNTQIVTISEETMKLPDNLCNAAEILFYNDMIKLVKELPSTYRMAFNLAVIDGYTHTEIAEILNIPVSTSRSNLLRARTMLQKSFIQLENNKRCSM